MAVKKDSGKKKVLWVSDLVTPTGFARVSHSILNEEFLNKYDVVGLGINYRGDPHNYTFPIFPAASGGRIFGENRLVELLNNAEFDILYLLNDAWIINEYLKFIKKEVKKPLPKIVVYFPVDSEYHDSSWYSNFDIVSKAVTYTKFGKAVVNHADCAPDLDLDIIPHGVNQKMFYKKFSSRRDAKVHLFGNSRNPDSFMFLNANRNQPRKRLDVTLEGFKLFAEGKDDVLIHMHCGIVDSHIDIARMAKRFDIESKLVLTNMSTGVQRVSDDMLNDIYNASDVGLNTSMGEGWGLTSIEHAMTGAPQIVPDHSACSEIFYDCGVLVPTTLNFTFDNSMTVGKLVSPVSLADKMQALYDNKELVSKLSDESIKKFSDQFYSWDEISKKWSKLFEEVLQ
jgi:glycosyltransferase involved in cell wall biosynthesis